MKVAYKIWIDQNGKAFGDGPYQLLRGVERTGSLHRAAEEMGMAYSKAWKLLRTVEQRLGFPLLDRKVGGLSGGGSRMTRQAKEFMVRYGRFREEVKDSVENIYQRHFTPFQRTRKRAMNG